MRGDDFDAAEPLSVTFSAGSILGDQVDVSITIHDDLSVDGLKNFTAEVVSSAPVIPGSVATIFISDNDSEYVPSTFFLFVHMTIVLYIYIYFCNIYVHLQFVSYTSTGTEL